MSEKHVAVKVQDLKKTFKIPLEASSGIKQKVINTLKGRKGYREFSPLNGVSFEIEKGDFFGIVGRNGSGKSTLLKTIAGIYAPNDGLVQVNGTLVPFIELGVGFNPELTGRENVFLNGALLGFSHSEMEAMYDDIVDFAELEEFMDEKLKNYSSGMQVRLAFSIAIRAEGDILLLDEVLAVGDEAFQRKCYSYFAELKRNKKTVILVTHSMDYVQQFCNKALLLNKGKIIEYGNPAKVAGEYLELNRKEVNHSNNKSKIDPTENIYGVNAEVGVSVSSERLKFNIEVSAKQKVEDAIITFAMNRDTGEMVYRWSTDQEKNIKTSLKNGSTLKITLEVDNIFPDGYYDIQLAVKKTDRSEVYALFNQILTYELVNPEVLKRNSHWKPGERVKYEKN